MAEIGAGVFSAPVDFRIGQSPPDELSPELKAALTPVYESIQQIIQALVNECGIGQQSPQFWSQLAGTASQLKPGNLNRLYVEATEALQSGAAVNVFLSGGILKARNANATNNTKFANGFASDAIASGAVGEVILAHGVAIITGLTPGANYFLSTVNGLITNVAPVAAGNIEQYVGIAIDSTHLFFNLGYWIQH